MVLAQLGKAPMQAEERPLMGRQHQYLVGQFAKTIEGVQPVAQRVAIRLVDGDADRRGDARQHLVSGDQQAVLGAVQAGVLGRVTAADHHLPAPPADGHHAALLEAAEGGRRCRPEVLLADHGQEGRRVIGSQPGLAIELVEGPVRLVVLRRRNMDRLVLGVGHVHRAVEALGQPAEQPAVVVVEVGADQRQQRPALQHTAQHRLPHLAALLGAEAAVHRHPAVAVAQQVEVDVIEAERQRHAQPQHAGRHLQGVPGGRWRHPGEAQAGLQLVAVVVEVSHGRHRTAPGRWRPAPRANTAGRCRRRRRARTADRRRRPGRSPGAAGRPCAA
ncbi:hypothetical protein D3C78_1115050 [compost metagenome]